ncbi:tail fiber protein [Photorhabdus temperata]|uniref:Microcystin-dependent protein n=1 Tax=Photorhabdus temperata subsp. temperata Meg1 TaxID=1393735 RepID=A0A081S1J5_PHOTE|nr:tail fiber protein [Photorhabdus temperata]KER04798.1 microcystin-dependent protein [Photorhabdus temperata subsp. temperata Meg1]MCT8346553.1 tail fiber protein [Photorhabdus temperata]
MEKKYNLKNSGDNLENANIKSQGPSVGDLKNRFKEGSIPLQTDYADLINIADIGRKACGQAPQQNGPGEGLKLADDGTLNLKMGILSSQNFSPLILEKDILSVDLGSGLINKANGICVGQGNGIVVNNDNVDVKANNGINVDTNGVSVKSRNSTIKVESTGISVGIGWGVKIGGEGLDIKASSGISVDNNGVSVKAGNGITVNSDGVSIDPNKILPKGMIVMFSGSNAPTGWAFCDGNSGTPDLRSRFVMCGETISETGKSSNKASGNGGGKNFSRNTTSTVVSVNVTVQSTTLTESQIPKHKHIESMPYYNTRGFAYDYTTIGKTGYKIDNSDNGYIWTKSYGTNSSGSDYHPHTSETGGGQGHNHDATASSPSHTHSIDVVPPYYILAFIMKL